MTSERTGRLSLNKKAAVKKITNKPAPTNTILSMFKKQTDNSRKSEQPIIVESGSEGDVIITKVTTSNTGTVLTGNIGDHHTYHADDHDSKFTKKSKVKGNRNLSLCKGDKIKTKYEEHEKSKCSELSKQKNKVVSIDTKPSASHYRLRRRKTVPYLDSLDSKSIEESEATNHDIDTDGHMQISNAVRKNNIEDDKRINRGKRKLSLKKSKTESNILSSETKQKYKRISEDKNSICNTSNSMELTLEKNDSKTILVQKTRLPQIDACDSNNRGVNIEVPNSDNAAPDASQTTLDDVKEIPNCPDNVQMSAGSRNAEEGIMLSLRETYSLPYYLENFRTILDTVLVDEKNAKLFNSQDMAYITAFNQISEPCQKLYVRIFSRKLAWLPLTKLKYPGISGNISELVEQLVITGLLHSGEHLTEIPLVLKSLAVPELKLLAKSFLINSAGVTKERLLQLLVKKSEQNSISNMFGGGVSTATTMLNSSAIRRIRRAILLTGAPWLKFYVQGHISVTTQGFPVVVKSTTISKAKSYLGSVCRLKEEARAVFVRILMLFNLYNTNIDEEQNQLFQMLMANIGNAVYPKYTVNKQRCIFADRGSLVRFETALQFEIDIQNKIEKKKWSDAHDIFTQAKHTGSSILQDEQLLRWDRKLPVYLRLYTAGSVYVRINNAGVEILQKLKQYTAAVELLEELLAQDLYCTHIRGHWYERLALNIDAHLKTPHKSLDVVKRGLLDEAVRSGRRLALYERAKKICEAYKSKYSNRIEEFHHEPIIPTPEVYIDGMVISDATSMGMKYQFVMQGDADSTTLCAVEELVLEHYKVNNYPQGLHAEGSIVSNLFVLLFWDIMFMDVVDVFHGPFQSCPLDMYSQDFYTSRKQQLDKRLEWLRKVSVEDLCLEIREVWENQEGKICIGMNWEKFTGSKTHEGLVTCMGGEVIAYIMERYVKDPRHTRSGFPDLTVWNTDTKKFKICEVKGPNDRLSYKQILWIDYLLKHGIDAEVCYVKAVGSKKLKPTS